MDFYDANAFGWSGFEYRGPEEKYKLDGSSDIIYRVTGKQRTGTNYIHTMINNNFKDLNFYIYKFGGKHALPPRRREFKNTALLNEIKRKKFICVLTIKNPYLWANSIGAWKPSYKLDKWFPKTQILEYNKFYHDYKILLENGCSECLFDDIVLVRYEDMLKDENKELELLSRKFSVKAENNLRKPDRVAFSKPFTEERRQYFLNQRPHYGKRLIRKVNKYLNWDVMKFYGYDKIDT
jgi:hypothetical protein